MSYWDEYFARHRTAGTDLDWGGRWTEPFLPLLRNARADRVLELGCGSGNDAARLARAGFEVVAVDASAEAIGIARKHQGVEFLVADMTEPLPFADASFDAVMANVSLHMFPDALTRAHRTRSSATASCSSTTRRTPARRPAREPSRYVLEHVSRVSSSRAPRPPPPLRARARSGRGRGPAP